jgi:hypothetical protein
MENRNIARISYGGGTTVHNHNDIKSVGVPLSYNVIHLVKWPNGTHKEYYKTRFNSQDSYSY